MKKVIITICLMLVVSMCSVTPVSAGTTDKGLVKSYCEKHYNMAPKYVSCGSSQVKHHKGKMIVEVVPTTSLGGKWGKTKDGYKVKYNKKVKKGKKVKSYLIYNPKTNYIDDVVAVVDNHRIR